MGPGNVSDVDEPSDLFPGQNTSLNDLTFANGFENQNTGSISTCGGPARSVFVAVPGLSLWLHLDSADRNASVSFELPIVSLEFHYVFPPNAGIWQIDNLSAPGGPGGGWAFAYSPCS
jgi:hypothetical protein